MSLILTQINKYGIVFAADSNITVNNTTTEKGNKIFRIPQLKAALCLAGSYSVGGEKMDNWMAKYIKVDNSISLEKFCHKLCDNLQTNMTEQEKQSGCIIHVSGFVRNNNKEHPEMWGIGNMDLAQDGSYSIRLNGFLFREDFWSRDWTNNNLKVQFNSVNNRGYQYYINGFTPGRVGFNILSKYLNDFLNGIWNTPSYKFRPPKDIKEYESLARFTMEFIALMFNLSEYLPKYIGGRISSFVIRPRDQLWFTQ